MLRSIINLFRRDQATAKPEPAVDPTPAMSCPSCLRPMIFLPSGDPIFDRFGCGYCQRLARQYRADAAATTKMVTKLRRAQRHRKKPRRPPTLDRPTFRNY